MISGSLGQHGKFRLWRNLCSTSPDTHDLVLEAMMPRGARILYGMLGIHVLPTVYEGVLVDERRTTISLFSNNEDFLIAGFEPVYIGMPEHYVSATMAGFKRALTEGAEVELNRLRIFYSAYGNVSSSEVFFEKIGFALVRLFTGSHNIQCEQTISSMLEEALK
ncbi:hypothetical protein [Pseudomonas nabeulensis]|nr:hypothetical protein [Pseudomonas nabeulensis]